MTLGGKPFGGGFETTTLMRHRVRRAVKRREDAVLEILHLRRPAVAPAAEVVELFLAQPFERRQRRVEVRKRPAGVNRRRELPDFRRREDVPLEFGNALEELARRRRRRFHVLVDRPERLRFERGGRTILLIRRGVLQHVQRGHRPGERHVCRHRIVRQPNARRQRHTDLDERPRPQEREVVVAVIRVDRAEQRIGRVGVGASRTLEPLPSRFDCAG